MVPSPLNLMIRQARHGRPSPGDLAQHIGNNSEDDTGSSFRGGPTAHSTASDSREFFQPPNKL